jgi:hypothetical protein
MTAPYRARSLSTDEVMLSFRTTFTPICLPPPPAACAAGTPAARASAATAAVVNMRRRIDSSFLGSPGADGAALGQVSPSCVNRA